MSPRRHGKSGQEQLEPIFLALGETVPYEEIRLVVAHMEAQQG